MKCAKFQFLAWTIETDLTTAISLRSSVNWLTVSGSALVSIHFPFATILTGTTDNHTAPTEFMAVPTIEFSITEVTVPSVLVADLLEWDPCNNELCFLSQCRHFPL